MKVVIGMLTPGTVVTLDVVREAPFGYFLSDGEEDVLLHQTEIMDGFDAEEPQEVFLYQDGQGRLAATMTIPKVQINQYGWVEVVEVKERLGVFVNIGIKKDILLSVDDLPELKQLWPEIGAKLYCSLKIDKKNRLFAKLATEPEMRKLSIPAERAMLNKNISGTVYKLLLEGTIILTTEGYIGFIHQSERKEEPRLGQTVSGRVIDVKPDGSVNISLLPRAFEQMDDDAESIFAYLMGRGGAMPYGDKSFPEEIDKQFNMSKSAFKRAIGKLMKEGRIYQEDGWTYEKKD